MDINNTKYELVGSGPGGAVSGWRSIPSGCAETSVVYPSPCRTPLQIKDIGSGNFGVAKLMRERSTGELIAIKFIERGEKVGRACRDFGQVSPACDRRGVLIPGTPWPPCTSQIDRNVEREIINHRELSGHPNIIRFREVCTGGIGAPRQPHSLTPLGRPTCSKARQRHHHPPLPHCTPPSSGAPPRHHRRCL